VAFADGNGMTVSCPFHIDGETKVAPRRAPSIGQHNAEVLREAGYSSSDIDRLRSNGVFGKG
jgi:formyl-CoA transferase